MNAEEAARKLFPPQDGAIPGVDRNEQARYAFVLGADWQEQAAQEQEARPPQQASGRATVRPELVAEAISENNLYPLPIGVRITEKSLEDALGRAIDETDPVATALHEQNEVLREILRVIKARR